MPRFREFLLREESEHAYAQAKDRIFTAARANPDIVQDPEGLLQLAMNNIRTAETIYKGPKTYAVQILPTFPALLSAKGSFPIPKTPQEARALPDFRQPHLGLGSVGNILVAILEPPQAHHNRDANQLNTSTVKFQRSPEIPVIGSRPRADQWIMYNQLQKDAMQRRSTPAVPASPPSVPASPPVTPSQLIDPAHPQHGSFLSWLKDKPMTKRQASKYLNQPTL